MALPVKQNLERMGIDMSVRTVDTSQYRAAPTPTTST